MTVRTRFAPSPTGFLHIGGARTALFNWLYARHAGGVFVLRIEDTDRDRSTREAEQAILEGMEWLGLHWDEGPIYQSQRLDHYRGIIEQMLTDGRAYYCSCSRERLEGLREEALRDKRKPRYDGHCRDVTEHPKGVARVVRFRNPDDGEVVFTDRTRGTVRMANSELDDLIIQRSDGTPTYNFCAVVDDNDLGITHVIRGDDHLNNTPRQINIYRALGAEPPAFAHVPMILGPDGSPLSKRHGAVSVLAYREQGYLPEALVNHLARLGWSHGDQEVFTIAELVEKFDIDEVNRKASVFDAEKLDWLNQQHMKTLPLETVRAHAGPLFEQAGVDLRQGPALDKLLGVQRQRAGNLRDLVEQSRAFYEHFESYNDKDAHKHLRPVVLEPLELLYTRLGDSPRWEPEELKALVGDVARELEVGMGKVAQPLRVALMGCAVSPSIEDTLWLMGRERTLSRLERALAWVRNRAEHAH